jgi:hypothetical protein
MRQLGHPSSNFPALQVHQQRKKQKISQTSPPGRLAPDNVMRETATIYLLLERINHFNMAPQQEEATFVKLVDYLNPDPAKYLLF